MENDGWEDVPSDDGWEDVPQEEAASVESKVPKSEREPFPYLNFIPGMKEVNQGFIQAGKELEEQFPGTEKSAERQQLVKEIGGSIALGGGAGALAKQLPKLAAKGIVPSATRLAIEGATGAQSFSYDSMKDRIKATAAAALATPVIGGAVSGGMNVGGKIISAIRNPAMKLAEVEQLIGETAYKYDELGSVINKDLQAEMAATRNNFNIAEGGIKGQLDVLDKEVIPEAADRATIQARKTWFDIAKDISKRFGDDWEKAIGGQKVNTEQLHQAIDNVIEKSGIRNKPPTAWSDSEKKIFDYWEKVGKQVPATSTTTEIVMGPMGPQYVTKPSGSLTLDLSKVDRELQGIFRPKSGTQYGSGDHILTTTREEIANLLGDTSNKIKAVRIKYAPELQMKNESYKIFQPFNRSGAYDTTKGINFFSKYANGKANPDEMRLIEALQSRTKGELASELNGLAKSKKSLIKQAQDLAIEKPKKFMSIKEKYAQIANKNSEDAMMHLSFLDEMKKDSIAAEAKRAFLSKMGESALKGAAGAAGAGAIAGTGIGLYKLATN